MHSATSTLTAKRVSTQTTIFFRIASGIALLSLVIGVACAQATPPVLRIAYPEFPPFHWKNKDNSMAGFFFDIITEAVEKRIGIPLVWTAYPWTRCQENLRSGVNDAILTVPTEDRARFTATHRHPFYIKDLHIFTAADHLRLTDIMGIRTIPDIKRLDLSVVTYSGNGWHKSMIESQGIKTYETPYLQNVWLMLVRKRADLVIEWPPGATPDLLRLGLDTEVTDTGIVLSSMPFHLLIRKDSVHTAILDRFDATIADMQRDGTINAILQRYIL
jgi:polar amino acid transport system substrate-binding protein